MLLSKTDLSSKHWELNRKHGQYATNDSRRVDDQVLLVSVVNSVLTGRDVSVVENDRKIGSSDVET